MKQFFIFLFAVLFCFSLNSFAQIPTATLVQIVKAEDERRFDQPLENLLSDSNKEIRARAALAAGRIGDEHAVPALIKLLQEDSATEVRAMAAFALGEIESVKAADAILEILQERSFDAVRARAREAAGKIAAANPKDENSKKLGEAILKSMDYENRSRAAPNKTAVLLGLTAILRSRPENAEAVVKDFLNYSDARIRADALNTLARLRAKNANEKTREILQKDTDAVVRANAARLLGAAEDKTASDLLLKAALEDTDSRVRVSAIRSLASLKDASSADKLMARGEKLLDDYKKSKFANPVEQNELLEIAGTLGRILQNTGNARAVNLLSAFGKAENYRSPEIEIAVARIAPSKFSELQRTKPDSLKSDWRAVNATMAGVGELATAPDSAEITPVKEQAKKATLEYINSRFAANFVEDKTLSDALTAYASYKTIDLSQVLRRSLQHRDPVVRATAAGILSEQPVSSQNVEALKTAFAKALVTDKKYNDAQLAILDALYKLDKSASVGAFLLALNAPDYLVRKKAFQLLDDKDLKKEFPGINSAFESTIAEKKNQVTPYNRVFGTKLGQILNTTADYTRALSRKSAKAIVTTTKGSFAIEFFPQEAPLTVDNFIKLAKSNYFNNLTIHRVVPNFVVQDGDPRGDGNGGPGWEIRDEINEIPYERGMVGMALSGKDTGGSQWFITHSPQPHLDGGYTVFGKVNEADMKIVDNLVRGDKILSVKVIEGNSPQKSKRRKPAR